MRTLCSCLYAALPAIALCAVFPPASAQEQPDPRLAAYAQLLQEANGRLVQEAGALATAAQQIEALKKALAEEKAKADKK